MKRLALSASVLLALHASAQDGVWPAQADDESARFFALPMVRDTRELAAVAEEHLRAERFPEAITVLQQILEEHAHEVLPAESGEPGHGGTHPGAAEWALARLYALPEAARGGYRARFEPRAAEALARARLAPARTSLVAIPRRWPLAPSAARAWWALADLELESGQEQAAELACRRALALEQELGVEAPSERSAARLAWLNAREDAREAAQAPSPAPPGLPRGDAQAWNRPLDLAPFGANSKNAVGRCLQPIVADELVLVGSTLRLYAVDAFSGELRWQVGPPAGWSALPPRADAELFAGINYEQLLLAPAAGDGVALAVMQQPFTEYETEDWQGIEIMKAIPERRLHAFDLESGRALWDHAPKLSLSGQRQHWDGQGTYAERMMVAGSPVVAGARVLVPCYRMQGRIDYHVACYELASGELLWSTLVISGQRERNMFGRSVLEFSASPLVVSGERVLAQTELGTLASLDLFSGRIQWQITYRQITLPKTKTYNPPKRVLTWKHLTPPVVVGDVVVAAPSDSMEVMAVRLSNGALLWAYDEVKSLRKLHRETALLPFNLLVGADQDTLYLSGAKLSALHKAGGIGTNAPFVQRWTVELERSDSAPRVQLAADALLAPNEKERVAFERKGGARIPALSGDWGGGEAGFLCLADGALFSLSAQGLSGYFDWRTQLERVRRLADAGGEGPLRAAAELFLRHGTLQLAGGDANAARSALEEARSYFTRLREQSARPDARGELLCLRTLAESLTRLAREDEALAVLAGARPLARSQRELAELLFLEERILRTRGGPARIARLDELEACFGAQPLPAEVRAEAARRWLADAREGAGLEPEHAPLTTVLWVALERAGEHERAGDLAAALQDLHAALQHARSLALARGYPVASLVSERIARVRALPGGEVAYVPLEERALALLDAARASSDEAALEAVSERYPHSRAAEEAIGLLIERAAEARDAARVTRLVRAALTRGGLAPERETALLLVLAHTLGERGNAPLERALVSALARAAPAQVSSVPAYAGRPLAVLAAELSKDSVEPAAAPALFDERVLSSGQPELVAAEFLGALRPAGQAPESAPLELHLYATRDELRAYASNAPSRPLWTRTLDLGNPPCGFAPGRFVLGTQRGLVCLGERGQELWTLATGSPRDSDPPRELALVDGVLVVLLRSESVLALDATLGLPLWERALGADGNWSGPVLGDGYAVFFSQLHKQPPRALVLDLFRGRVTADIRLNGYDSKPALAEGAWVAEERLIAPAYGLRPAQLSAFALAGGQRAWTIEFGRDEELHAVAHSQGKAFPITLAGGLGQTAANGGVYELDERTGTVRRIVPLKPGERVMGLAQHLSTELPAPYLFTFTHSEKERSVPIRALHLPYGVQWSWALPIPPQDIYDGRSMPMPAVSSDCVAIAYQSRRAGGQGSEAAIVFVDKRAGKKVDTLVFGKDSPFAHANRLELRGLGDALFVLGKGSTPRGACLDILEKLR